MNDAENARVFVQPRSTERYFTDLNVTVTNIVNLSPYHCIHSCAITKVQTQVKRSHALYHIYI